MRILLVNTDYPAFLAPLYATLPGLAGRSYDEQMRVRNESLFGTADFYSRRLIELGHEAWDVHYNNRALQSAWAAERGFRLSWRPTPRFRLRRGFLPWLSLERVRWREEALAAQIEEYRPDVVHNLDVEAIPASFWRRMKGRFRLLVGQTAAPISPDRDLSVYDLLVSSLPNYVERFQRDGHEARYLPLAFEPRVLERVPEVERDVPVSFVGSLFSPHGARRRWLEDLCRSGLVQVWGHPIDSVGRGSPIRAAWRGTAWGIDMYRVLRRSRITLNRHIDIAQDRANNMRLFEATGCGAMLVTDRKRNLAELFEPGRDVDYDGAGECLDRVRHALAHDDERRRIAEGGQRRTLSEHALPRRMAEFAGLLEARLGAPEG